MFQNGNFVEMQFVLLAILSQSEIFELTRQAPKSCHETHFKKSCNNLSGHSNDFN